ncbi:hypothetical protein GCM10009621_14410 [Corynebacterium felinum]
MSECNTAELCIQKTKLSVAFTTEGNSDTAMFGLPDFTVAVIFGVSLIWIIYTLVFWIMSKNWHLADEPEGR